MALRAAALGLLAVAALTACSSTPAPYVYSDAGSTYECPLPPQSWVSLCPGYVTPHGYVAPYHPHVYKGSVKPRTYRTPSPTAKVKVPQGQPPTAKAPPPPKVKAPPPPKPPPFRAPPPPRPAPKSGR